MTVEATDQQGVRGSRSVLGVLHTQFVSLFLLFLFLYPLTAAVGINPERNLFFIV